jgi:hypothetical protein
MGKFNHLFWAKNAEMNQNEAKMVPLCDYFRFEEFLTTDHLVLRYFLPEEHDDGFGRKYKEDFSVICNYLDGRKVLGYVRCAAPKAPKGFSTCKHVQEKDCNCVE